ncbi:MAG: LPS assembly lipoprotein LptE [Pseudomonadota bacterium]
MIRLLALASLLLLGACGFHLRGPQPLPFASIYVAVADSSELGAALKRNIRAQGTTRVVNSPQEAEAILTVVDERTEKNILSLNSAGRVREYQLVYRFAFRVHNNKGVDLMPRSDIVLTRDITFNDEQVLAKENEEALLYRDMRADLVQQILRRMAAARPQQS